MLHCNAISQVEVIAVCENLPLTPPGMDQKTSLTSKKYGVCIYSFSIHKI